MREPASRVVTDGAGAAAAAAAGEKPGMKRPHGGSGRASARGAVVAAAAAGSGAGGQRRLVLDYDGFAILGKTPEQIKAQASASRALPADRSRTGRQNAPPSPNASPGGGGGGGGPIWNHDKGRVHPSHLYFPGSGYAPDALDPFSASNMDRTGRGGALRARPMPPQSHIRSSMSPDELARRVNYIDRRFLNEFLTERGSIVPRRRTGFSVKMQRALKREIKIAKSMALLSPLSKLSLDRRGR